MHTVIPGKVMYGIHYVYKKQKRARYKRTYTDTHGT